MKKQLPNYNGLKVLLFSIKIIYYILYRIIIINDRFKGLYDKNILNARLMEGLITRIGSNVTTKKSLVKILKEERDNKMRNQNENLILFRQQQ